MVVVSTVDHDLSDHLPVFQVIPLKTTETKLDKLYKKRLITKRNIEKLRDEMRNTNWENLQSINDADDAYKCFRDTFLNSYNSCIPEKQCSKK